MDARKASRSKKAKTKTTSKRKTKPAPKPDFLRIPEAKRIPPDRRRVLRYGRLIGMTQEQSEEFFDYWESVGWKRKAGKVRDWWATMRVRLADLRQKERQAIPRGSRPIDPPLPDNDKLLSEVAEITRRLRENDYDENNP